MNLSLTVLDWIILSVVLVGSLSFGLYMAFRKKAGESSSNFFLGGRSIKWPVIGASLFATNIGAEHLVGLIGRLVPLRLISRFCRADNSNHAGLCLCHTVSLLHEE